MKSYKVILLNAEKGYKLYNKASNVICSSVQLPADTDITTWEEITDEEAERIKNEQLDEQITVVE